VTTLVFSLANSQTQPTTHTEYPHTPTDGHALQYERSFSLQGTPSLALRR